MDDPTLFDLEPFTQIPDVKKIDLELLKQLEESMDFLVAYHEELERS